MNRAPKESRLNMLKRVTGGKKTNFDWLKRGEARPEYPTGVVVKEMLSPSQLSAIEALVPKFAQIKFRNEDQLFEAVNLYLPYLFRIAKIDWRGLLAELNYQDNQVRSRKRVYRPDPSRSSFLKRMLSGRKYYAEGLNWFERAEVFAICIELRTLYLPFHPVPASVRLNTHAPMKPVNYRSFTEYSDWEMVQKTLSSIGSCHFGRHDLDFLAVHWKEAWNRGPERFSFGNKWDRSKVEKIYTGSFSRERELYPEQMKYFLSKVRCDHVPLWEKQPAQLSLLEEGRLSEVDFKSPTTPDEEKSYRADPKSGQLDFKELLLRPWDGQGDLQYLFGAPSLPPWDGNATQQEILFK